jgi:uncharacterized protein
VKRGASAELLRVIRTQYRLPWDGIHGVSHWTRVREGSSAWRSGPGKGGSSTVRRYGSSAVQESAGSPELAARLRGTLFTLPDADFAQLQEACIFPTDGLLDAEATIQTCWDADRLDLPRVRITVDPARLCTAAARDPAILAWAGRRSLGANGSFSILLAEDATDPEFSQLERPALVRDRMRLLREVRAEMARVEVTRDYPSRWQGIRHSH